MTLVRMLYFCAAQHNIPVLVTHVAGTDNSIADALLILGPAFSQTCSGSSSQLRHHQYMAEPALEGLLSYYQSLGVAWSTHRTYVPSWSDGYPAILHPVCYKYHSQPHHFPYDIFAATWLARFHTRLSKYTLPIYGQNI